MGRSLECYARASYIEAADLVLYEAAAEQNRVFRILLRSFFLFLDKGARGEGV